MSNGKMFKQNSTRAAVQLPPAGAASPNPEENLLVMALRRQLQEKCHINAKQKHRLRELEEMLLQKELQVQDLQKELTDVKEEKKALTEFGKNLFNKIRQGVNKYVKGLYQENETLQTFTKEQQAIIFKKQAEVEEKVTSIQCLQKQVNTLKANSADVFEELGCANDTIEKLEVAMLNMSKKVKKYKEQKRDLKSKLQEIIFTLESVIAEQGKTTEETKNKNQELECGLTEQRKVVKVRKNKAQGLKESLNTEHNKVQELQRDLDKQKSTFMAVVVKRTRAHNALVEERTQYQNKVQELSTALNHSEEERTSALLKYEELQMSLKESEDQLQQTKAVVEELQAALDKKNRRTKRRRGDGLSGAASNPPI